ARSAQPLLVQAQYVCAASVTRLLTDVRQHVCERHELARQLREHLPEGVLVTAAGRPVRVFPQADVVVHVHQAAAPAVRERARGEEREGAIVAKRGGSRQSAALERARKPKREWLP